MMATARMAAIQEPHAFPAATPSSGARAQAETDQICSGGRLFKPDAGKALTRGGKRWSTRPTSRLLEEGLNSVLVMGRPRIGHRRPYESEDPLVYVPATRNFCGGAYGEKVPLDPGSFGSDQPKIG